MGQREEADSERWPTPRAIRVLGAVDDSVRSVRLEPAPERATAAIGAMDAYRIVQTSGIARTDDGPVITLALATAFNRGGFDEHGQLHLRIDQRLVQALRWDTMVMSTGGPAPSRGMPRRRPEPTRGVVLILIDAATGERLLHTETNDVRW